MPWAGVRGGASGGFLVAIVDMQSSMIDLIRDISTIVDLALAT